MATLDSVVLYDTQSVLPLAVLGQLHYESITDLAWSSDGQYLAVSSRDCYCRWVGADVAAGFGGWGLEVCTAPLGLAWSGHCTAMCWASVCMQPAPNLNQPNPTFFFTLPLACPACSIAAFDAGELGTPLAADKLPSHIAKRMASAQRLREPLPVAPPTAGRSTAPGKAAATPTAQPPATAAKLVATAAAATAAPSSAAAAPDSAVQKPQPAAEAAAAVSGRKRIQPEPVLPSASPAGGAAAAFAAPMAEQPPAAKKPKRIVPETVGPAPAVVGDSQQVRGTPGCFRLEPVCMLCC